MIQINSLPDKHLLNLLVLVIVFPRGFLSRCSIYLNPIMCSVQNIRNIIVEKKTYLSTSFVTGEK